MSQIQSQLRKLKKELEGKAELIAVSKTFPVDSVIEAYQAGQRDFGENKVQDLLQKATELQELDEVSWHFIGHLQSNKINQLLKCPNLKFIHSIDSISLLEKLIKKEAVLEQNKIKIFLQVNTSGESEKSGFKELDGLLKAVELAKKSKCFEVIGLMTIGPIRTDSFEEDTKKSFQMLIDFRDKINSDFKLSMGMSSDYQWALEYGADYIRVGSMIFGKRK